MAHLARWVLLLCRTDTELPKHRGLTMFLVPLDAPGVVIHPVHTYGGERTNVTFYSDVRVPDTARVELDFAPSHEPVYLTMDGQIGFQLDAKDRVVITKSQHKVQVVKPPTMTYYEILRSKLRWSER